MKKFILLSFAALLIGCENPSMERGFESLTDSLNSLESDLSSIVESITSDLQSMNETVDVLLANAAAMQETKEEILIATEDLALTLSEIQEDFENANTEETLSLIGDKLESVNDDLGFLIFVSDYDLDGVINGLDQCPDTPITEINEVNNNGCSPSQLED